MRKVTLIAVGATLAIAGSAQARWVATPHHRRAASRFVSHYCQTTQSPYIGLPPSRICCVWAPYWKSIPDGDGTWNCVITNPPITPERRTH